MIHHKNETENMLSSLDTLAEKISPGSGKSSPNQPQANDASLVGTTTITSSVNSIGQRTHFSQSIHPYQKLEQNNNNNTSNNNNSGGGGGGGCGGGGGGNNNNIKSSSNNNNIINSNTATIHNNNNSLAREL